MIDEYDKNYFLLSCDICGITEAGPFHTFYEAVDYAKENRNVWKSIFMKCEKTKKHKWHDVCNNPKCLKLTPLGTWKTIPTSKRTNKEIKTDDNLTNIANSIAKTIIKRKEEGTDFDT